MAARPAAQRTSSTNLGRGQTQRTLEGKFGIVTGGSRGESFVFSRFKDSN